VRVRLYLDEDVDVALAGALRRRGIDVLTTQEAKNVQRKDEDQLAFKSVPDTYLGVSPRFR
jgi:hypothetical protein